MLVVLIYMSTWPAVIYCGVSCISRTSSKLQLSHCATGTIVKQVTWENNPGVISANITSNLIVFFSLHMHVATTHSNKSHSLPHIDSSRPVLDEVHSENYSVFISLSPANIWINTSRLTQASKRTRTLTDSRVLKECALSLRTPMNSFR